MDEHTRERHTYAGIVQGVGFRPTVFRCATSLGLTGYVRNERSVVLVELQGQPQVLLAFHDALLRMLPGAARVDRHTVERIPRHGDEMGFRIQESVRTSFTLPPIPPDLAICADCTREILDPGDRRYLYPFTSCTQCGPRYTIVRDTPFDRANTSMADFPLCADCRREYEDSGDRRFHAQIMACPRCGPTLRIWDAGGRTREGDPLLEAIQVLARGGTVALLGLGGFHLAADPMHDGAIRKLRRDKDRERKPFALMVRDMEVARELVDLGAADRALLAGPTSPILIAPARPQAAARMRAVSDTGTLGIMLPYTPLHLLLFRHPGTKVPYESLVMTSGNLRDEPIITDPALAVRELAGIADAFLVHDRAVVFRADDTVVRPLSRGRPEHGADPGSGSRQTPAARRPSALTHILIRRSRGRVPGTLTLARAVPEPTLAVGGDLKCAPALAVGADVHLAPHVGDLDSLPTREAFERQTEGMLSLYHVEPVFLVHDAHPGYVSTRWALETAWGRKVAVQHHHAHILSVLAEHGLDEALGLSFDGTGYGQDGTIWGGELLHATRSGYRRLGSFAPFPLAGGDAAVRHPLRIAYGLLRASHPRVAAGLGLDPGERDLVDQMLAGGVSTVLTSSLGRVFDAAAAVLGLVRELGYEGEGPIRLEGLAAGCRTEPGLDLPMPLLPSPSTPDTFVLDAAPAISRLAHLAATGADRAELALAFHQSVARACVAGALRMREMTGQTLLAASGGVFQNVLLRSLLFPALEEAGFRIRTNRDVPPGDGGLALGQLWYQTGAR